MTRLISAEKVRRREQSHCESADLDGGSKRRRRKRIGENSAEATRRSMCEREQGMCGFAESLSACPRAKFVCRSDKKNQKKNNKQDMKEDSTTPRGERLQRASARCLTEALPSLKYWNEMGYFQPSSHTPAPTAAPKGPSRVI